MALSSKVLHYTTNPLRLYTVKIQMIDYLICVIKYRFIAQNVKNKCYFIVRDPLRGSLVQR